MVRKNYSKSAEKKMTNEQIVSAITGRTLEEIRNKIKEKTTLHKKFKDFIKELQRTSKSDKEFIVTLTSFIATMLYPLPKEIRLNILFLLTLHEEENMSDKIKKMIKKFAG